MKTPAVSAPALFAGFVTPGSATPARLRLPSRAIGLSAAATLALASPAFAYLGSFAPADGYHLGVYSGSVNWSDVSYYDAGASGANAGGGAGPNLITPDSGKWKVVGQVARSAALGASPPYPGTLPPGTLPIYIVGNHGPGRTDGSALAFRNDTPLGGVGAAVYDYTIDTYDTGGTVPATVTNGIVGSNLYFNANPNDPINPGTHPLDKFNLSFMDSSGNIGAQWGYARDNEIYWRAGSAGPWNYTGLYANNGAWDGMSVKIDLTADTFQIDYYDVIGNTTINIAPAGTALGAAMNNLTTLRWQLEDGVNSGVGGKNFFDDATFTIPAPGSLGLFGLGALVGLRRRRS